MSPSHPMNNMLIGNHELISSINIRCKWSVVTYVNAGNNFFFSPPPLSPLSFALSLYSFRSYSLCVSSCMLYHRYHVLWLPSRFISISPLNRLQPLSMNAIARYLTFSLAFFFECANIPFLWATAIPTMAVPIISSRAQNPNSNRLEGWVKWKREGRSAQSRTFLYVRII